MEKFAVDLDQVLDEFELCEDGPEQQVTKQEVPHGNSQDAPMSVSGLARTMDLTQTTPLSLHRAPPQHTNYASFTYDTPYDALGGRDLLVNQPVNHITGPDLINNHTNGRVPETGLPTGLSNNDRQYISNNVHPASTNSRVDVTGQQTTHTRASAPPMNTSTDFHQHPFSGASHPAFSPASSHSLSQAVDHYHNRLSAPSVNSPEIPNSSQRLVDNHLYLNNEVTPTNVPMYNNNNNPLINQVRQGDPMYTNSNHQREQTGQGLPTYHPNPESNHPMSGVMIHDNISKPHSNHSNQAALNIYSDEESSKQRALLAHGQPHSGLDNDTDSASEASVQDSVSSTMSSLSPPSVSEYSNESTRCLAQLNQTTSSVNRQPDVTQSETRTQLSADPDISQSGSGTHLHSNPDITQSERLLDQVKAADDRMEAMTCSPLTKDVSTDLSINESIPKDIATVTETKTSGVVSTTEPPTYGPTPQVCNNQSELSTNSNTDSEDSERTNFISAKPEKLDDQAIHPVSDSAQGVDYKSDQNDMNVSRTSRDDVRDTKSSSATMSPPSSVHSHPRDTTSQLDTSQHFIESPPDGSVKSETTECEGYNLSDRTSEPPNTQLRSAIVPNAVRNTEKATDTNPENAESCHIMQSEEDKASSGGSEKQGSVRTISDAEAKDSDMLALGMGRQDSVCNVAENVDVACLNADTIPSSLIPGPDTDSVAGTGSIHTQNNEPTKPEQRHQAELDNISPVGGATGHKVTSDEDADPQVTEGQATDSQQEHTVRQESSEAAGTLTTTGTDVISEHVGRLNETGVSHSVDQGKGALTDVIGSDIDGATSITDTAPLNPLYAAIHHEGVTLPPHTHTTPVAGFPVQNSQSVSGMPPTLQVDSASDADSSAEPVDNSHSSLDEQMVNHLSIREAEPAGGSPHSLLEDQMLQEMLQQPLQFEDLLPPVTDQSKPLDGSTSTRTGSDSLEAIHEQMKTGGARPKDTSTAVKKSRPNSLLGLSTVSLAAQTSNQEASSVSSQDASVTALTQSADHALKGLCLVDSAMTAVNGGVGMMSRDVVSSQSQGSQEVVMASSHVSHDMVNSSPQTSQEVALTDCTSSLLSHDVINRQLAQQSNHGNVQMRKKQINQEIKQQIQSGQTPETPGGDTLNPVLDNRLLNSAPPGGDVTMHPSHIPHLPQRVPSDLETTHQNHAGVRSARPCSAPPAFMQPPSTLPGAAQSRQKRPTSLNLPPRDQYGRQGASPQREMATETNHTPTGQENSLAGVTDQPPVTHSEPVPGLTLAPDSIGPPPAYHQVEPQQSQHTLGKVAPEWLRDADAANCMLCEVRFTFTKRRHHCRACGKIFCSTCCNLRCKLEYMDFKEARVCSLCFQAIVSAEARVTSCAGSSPNPNNPSEYCSTVPPLQQAAGTLNAPPPTVMVPVGVLKREGSQRRGEPKQVMFSDGIRPGGDLTELDGSSDMQRMPPRRSGRTQKKVERPPPLAENTTDSQPTSKSSAVKTKTLRSSEVRHNPCLIPAEGLPPVILSTGVKGDYTIEENPDPEKILPQIRNADEPRPVVFAVNKNLLVLVKILNMDCCVNRVCWCFTTQGLCAVGQDEVVMILECLPDEKTIPQDVFRHFQTLYEQASQGNTVGELGHTIFSAPFLGSRDHGGLLYIRTTFQCLQKLTLPSPPFLVAVLLQKWETPWAKVFPLRLMLRLGAEFRYYPCPLISVRFRKPVFGEIGHTIMNLLADFRNYQYMLAQIRGVTIYMEDKKTYINFPRNRYNQVMKVVNNSNDHVVALGSNFSSQADSHLVCMQNEDGNYQTQAINIQSKPRKMTGASFVVFNGALKSSSGLSAKSSIVEDGLMVQITAEAMMALKSALTEMKDYTIACGNLGETNPDEVVMTRWVDDDKAVNIGVQSVIDSRSLEGVESVRINSAVDYVGATRRLRWTEVFFLLTAQSDSRCEPVDLSRLAETLSRAASLALTGHLDKLKEAGLTKLALRVTVDTEQVGYEVGANGEKLPDCYMNDLDNELIPVIHNAASQSHDNPISLELVFYVID